MEFSDLILSPWVLGPACSIAAVLLLIFLKRRLFALIQRLTSRTANRMDDVLLSAAGRPLNLLIMASGLLLLGRILPLGEEADTAFALAYKVIVIASFVWFADRLAAGLLELYSERVVFLRQGRGIISGLLRGLLLGLGLLILLDSMGISITPLLASLGVGSLAVALALQGTLANLFAGFHVLADKSIEPGQFVKLESGEEGFVERIGWRSTRVRMRSDVMLILPNSRIVDSMITNYDLPDTPCAFLVPVGVHYDSDLGQVERVTVEVARDVMREVDGGVPEFEPFIRYGAFADSSINFSVILRVTSYPAHNLVKHEFIKRLHERYRHEGIVIPFPIRTLDIPDPVLDRMAGARS
ncbi:MAG TPA: mechanosensitive ion channel family protein [Candidatus Polarisedimenticolia bacterium]|nr:mechanosensitive ion channel family protein [Candidatus Polarisedimenticolia bacterium]